MTITTFNNLLGTLVLLVLCFGCSRPQEPIFKGVENLRATSISTKRITLQAEAVYHNPNTLGGQVVSTDIQVIANDIPAATIEQDSEIDIPATSEFRIPLTCNISPKDIYENDRSGALGGLLNAVLRKKIDVVYKGKILVRIAGFRYTLPIELEEEVVLK